MIVKGETARLPQQAAPIATRWVERGLQLAYLGDQTLWTAGREWRPITRSASPAFPVSTPGVVLNPAAGFLASVPSVCTKNGLRSFVTTIYHTASATGRVWQDTSGDGTAEGEGLWVASGGPFYLRSATNASGFKQWTAGAYSGPNNTWYTLGHSHNQTALANNPLAYVNGVYNSTPTSVQDNAGAYRAGSGTIGIGNRPSDSARAWPGFIARLLLFDCLLTADEHLLLARSPGALFEPRRIIVPVSVGAGTLPTLTNARVTSVTTTTAVPVIDYVY